MTTPVSVPFGSMTETVAADVNETQVTPPSTEYRPVHVPSAPALPVHCTCRLTGCACAVDVRVTVGGVVPVAVTPPITRPTSVFCANVPTACQSFRPSFDVWIVTSSVGFVPLFAVVFRSRPRCRLWPTSMTGPTVTPDAKVCCGSSVTASTSA